MHCVTDTFCVGPVANDLKLDGLFLFNEGGAGGGIFGLETGGIIRACVAFDAKFRIGAGRFG